MSSIGFNRSTATRANLERTGQTDFHGESAACALIWSHRLDPDSKRSYVAPPDGYADVVVAARSDGLTVHLVGTDLTMQQKTTRDIRFVCCGRIRVGVIPILTGLAARELRARAIAGEDLWPDARGLVESMLDAPSMSVRAKRLARFLDSRLLSRVTARDDLPAIEKIVRGVERTAHVGALGLRAIARDVGTSERTLRRVFDHAVGMSPRTFLALPRFRRALVLLAHSSRTGGRIAAEAGYADQAHMVRDVRARVGATPEELRRSWEHDAPLFRPEVTRRA
jgi:AraC-like DNA-binding protein